MCICICIFVFAYVYVYVYVYIYTQILVTHSYMHVIYACLYNTCFLDLRSSKSPNFRRPQTEMPDSEKAATHLRDLGGVLRCLLHMGMDQDSYSGNG